LLRAHRSTAARQTLGPFGIDGPQDIQGVIDEIVMTAPAPAGETKDHILHGFCNLAKSLQKIKRANEKFDR
jgi:hypothetical protein